MGYVRQKRIYRLVFEDDEYEGLLVRARSISLGQLRDIELAETGPEDDPPMMAAFINAVVEWNLENEDDNGNRTPVPVTVDGLHTQEPDFVKLLIDTWVDALTGVRGPLGKPSSDGNMSQEQSNLMELASLSQVS